VESVSAKKGDLHAIPASPEGKKPFHEIGGKNALRFGHCCCRKKRIAYYKQKLSGPFTIVRIARKINRAE